MSARDLGNLSFPFPCLAAGSKSATSASASMARVSRPSSWHAEFRSHLLQMHFCPHGCLSAIISSLYQMVNELHSLSSLTACVMSSSEVRYYYTPMNARSYILGGDETFLNFCQEERHLHLLLHYAVIFICS